MRRRISSMNRSRLKVMGGWCVQRRKPARPRRRRTGRARLSTSEGPPTSRAAGVATTIIGSRTPPRRAERPCGDDRMRQVSTCSRAALAPAWLPLRIAPVAMGGGDEGYPRVISIAALAASMSSPTPVVAPAGVGAHPLTGPAGSASSWFRVENDRLGRLMGSSSGASSHRARQ